jgi:hypothetical protein
MNIFLTLLGAFIFSQGLLLATRVDSRKRKKFSFGLFVLATAITGIGACMFVPRIV